MPVVIMPDGTHVMMPDQIDPALGARLREFHDTTPHETTSGPAGFVNALGEIVGKGVGNIPMGAVHGVQDLVSRATGKGPRPSEPTFPLSPNAQSVAQDIGGALGAAAEPYRVKAAEPFLNENVAPVLEDVAAIAPVAGAAKGIAGAVRGAETAALPHEALGLRTAEAHPIAAGAGGPEAQSVLGHQNVQAATTVAGAQAGVPHGTMVTPETLAKARAAPGAVLDRAATDLPHGPLSSTASQMVQDADSAGRITKGTPNAVAQIKDIKDRLLDPNAQFTGPQVRAEATGLRFDGNNGINSADPDIRQVSQFKRSVADALDQHVEDMLPAASSTSIDQVKLARQTLAKNYTVGDLMRGPHLDLKGLGKLHQDNPNLLTGDLRTLGQFAVDHPEVSALPSGSARFAPPGLQTDIGKAIGGGGESPRDVGDRLSRIFGVQAGARRILTGNPEESLAAARSRPVAGLGGEFEPIDRTPQPPPGLTAGPMGAPPAAAEPPGQIPLADVLAHGVEQSPAPGLSLGPMGAPPAAGIPFTRNAAHEAGGLTLDEGLNGPFRGQPMSMSDFAGVKSQGVPENIMARSSRPSAPEFADLGQRPNNASGESAASLEAQSRLGSEKAAGVKPVIFGDTGVTPLLHDVTAVDRAPPRGHIILDANTGKVINGGGLKPSAVQALLNRWRASRLGEAF